MDLVHESDEPVDIGVCHDHNRVFQCYCKQCYCMICPSCLMFGTHKGHDVCRIQDGSKDLRNAINTSAKEGNLKFDRTENVLLDIRHVKLSLEENQERILSQAEKNFDELISILKNRKKLFINRVKDHFNAQLKKIDETETEWVGKQELCQKILKLQTSKDDNKVMEESKSIVQGLKELARPLEYKEMRLLESIKSQSTLGKNTISFDEIKEILGNFMQAGDPILNKLKC